MSDSIFAELDSLSQWEAAAGFQLTDSDRQKLVKLVELWRKYGGAINLTSDLDRGLVDQIGEGLLALGLERRLSIGAGSWLDIGSGGGFPGLVVAALSERQIVMVEPRQKRASFLEVALANLGRSDCLVRQGRLDERGWKALDGRGDLPGDVALSGARAVFPIARWLEVATDFLKASAFVFGHLPVDALDPKGYRAVDRVDFRSWSVRAYLGGSEDQSGDRGSFDSV